MNSPSRSPITVGTVVAETYTLEALIGRGGMGEVYAASHVRLPGKQVAIKFLHPEVADPEILARFRREAEIATRLGHPNIVTVLDFNNLPDGTPYLVLEYLVGETLFDALQRGPMEVERAFAILRQVGSALAAAHRAGVVHRDLKPQNIFLVPTEIEGRIGEHAKVLDFGISKIRGSQTVKTQDSALLGTPQYMAPEQAMGQHDSVDGRTDIFALGVIVYEMLCGQSAFAGSSIPEVVFKVVYEAPPPLVERAPGLAPHILAAVERAMAKKPDERFATVGELITALTGVGLATLPPNAALVPGPRPTTGRKVDSAAALAQTMGSGDHAAAIAATSAGLPPVTPIPGQGSAAAAGSAAPTAWERPRATGAGEGSARGSSTRWKILAAVFAAIAVAVVTFLLVRPSQRGGGPTVGGLPPTGPISSPPTTPATPPTHPTVVVDAGTVVVSPDSSVATVADAGPKPSRPDAGTRPPRPDAGTRPPRPDAGAKPPTGEDDPQVEEPGEIKDKLARAWSAAEEGKNQIAKTTANAIIDDPQAGERARRQANQILVLIACRTSDRETAVRSAKRARVVRPAIVAECAKNDIELPVPRRR